MNETPNKNVTLGTLAQSIEELAIITAKGFANTSTKADVANLEVKVTKIEADIAGLERGQEDILLKLDNVAYRFELVALQKRVEHLEKRSGIKPATSAA